MSDRGYIALSLEVRAKAIEARIEAMKCDNDWRRRANMENFNYEAECFFQAEKELNDIADQIRGLAP